MGPLLLLLLPALASSRIIINIQTSDSTSKSSVDLRGSVSSVITDNERTTFGIPDEVLRNAAEKFSGGKPQDVFLHSPTPWNDLYLTYNWREVHRVLKPVKSHILDVQTDKIVVTLKEFVNNSTFKATFDASLMSDVENFVENKWNKAGVLDIKEPIIYSVNGSTFFSFASPWGTNSRQSKKVTLGPDSDVEVLLNPGQVVSSALIATKVTMTVQIDYATSLSGHVACNYPKKYNGHHFWRYDINELMRSAGLTRILNSSEVIRVQFYTDANIVVMDKASNSMISETTVGIKK